MHISGASGSGKTFLGNRLKEQYRNKIIVQDLDDLRDKFIKNFYGTKNGLILMNKNIKIILMLLLINKINRMFLLD